jgi:nucleotide-binding universal stress UspA family protein
MSIPTDTANERGGVMLRKTAIRKSAAAQKSERGASAKKGRKVFHHVLIPTDGSPLSNKAARAGIALASALGAEVTAYYAVDELQPLYAEGYLPDQTLMEDLDQRAKALGEKRVDAIGKMARAAGVRFNALVKKAGTAHEGIIETARRRRCDVIFMASHGRRGLARLILGSVTQRVLTHSKIPVMVYR